MSARVMINGRAFAPEEATVSVFDRGFLYGDSVFETIRTYGGRPFELEAHVRRLAQSAARVFIDLPVSGEDLMREVQQAVAASGNEESYIRLMVTRGSGELGLAPDSAMHPLRVVIVLPLTPPPPEWYERGIEVITYRTARTADQTTASGAKVANYLVSVLAMRQAARAGAQEAIVVDGEGRALEGTTSNLFVRIDGELVTTPEDAGILAGITRARVLTAASAIGVPVSFRVVSAASLARAQEVFISSSIRELVPVVRIDGAPVADGRPGPVTRALLARFREDVRRDMGLGAPGTV